MRAIITKVLTGAALEAAALAVRDNAKPERIEHQKRTKVIYRGEPALETTGF